MKKYFIDRFFRYCYPYQVSHFSDQCGVLEKYIGKTYTRKEIDKIICEMIMSHPYIDNSMSLEINVMWTDENSTGYYHTLRFLNDKHKKQNRGDLSIKYE